MLKIRTHLLLKVQMAVYSKWILQIEVHTLQQKTKQKSIKINNGKLLDYNMDTLGGSGWEPATHRLCLTISILNHTTGKPWKEHTVLPTHTKRGYHSEVATCRVCNDDIESIIYYPSFGHSWGEWEIIKEPTIFEEGLKQRICKTDLLRIETQILPLLDLCVVTFDNRGHGIAPEPQRVAVGDTVAEPKNMTASGYVFCGCHMDPECTTLFDFQTPITQDITLYAKWIPSANVGTGNGSNTTLWFMMLGLSLFGMMFVVKPYLLSKTNDKLNIRKSSDFK